MNFNQRFVVITLSLTFIVAVAKISGEQPPPAWYIIGASLLIAFFTKGDKK